MIRLRPGITFHDGRDLTADDVIFTFRRIISGHFTGSIALGPVHLAGLRKLDARTVLVPMTSPYASFPDQLAAFWYYLYIVPAGFDPAKPNGTGPFVFGSFTPGQRSVFSRNPHYFRTGLPYADTLSVIDFSDGVSLQNALQTGAVQGAGTLEGAQIAALGAASGYARWSPGPAPSPRSRCGWTRRCSATCGSARRCGWPWTARADQVGAGRLQHEDHRLDHQPGRPAPVELRLRELRLHRVSQPQPFPGQGRWYWRRRTAS